MKKILLIGKLSDILRSISEKLGEDFNLQITPMQLDNISGMIRITKPDMVIVCTIGLDGIDRNIFRWINQNIENLPVLMVTSNEDKGIISTECNDERFMFLHPPVSGDVILNKCKSLLHVGGDIDVAGLPYGKKKVLVIDDSPIILRNVRVILQDKYDVMIATDGSMGIRKAIEYKPDIILLDYEMPGMDGNATFQKLLECSATKNIPVIFLTSVSDGRKVREVLDKHPAGYILKTLDTDKLISKLEEVLAQRK